VLSARRGSHSGSHRHGIALNREGLPRAFNMLAELSRRHLEKTAIEFPAYETLFGIDWGGKRPCRLGTRMPATLTLEELDTRFQATPVRLPTVIYGTGCACYTRLNARFPSAGPRSERIALDARSGNRGRRLRAARITLRRSNGRNPRIIAMRGN